jgi:hypothetical protein
MLILPQATVLGPLEHAVMRIVWAHAAPITVKHVFEALSADRDVAYTTVMTTMVRLAEKGLLTRAPCKAGRAAWARVGLSLYHRRLARRAAAYGGAFCVVVWPEFRRTTDRQTGSQWLHYPCRPYFATPID